MTVLSTYHYGGYTLTPADNPFTIASTGTIDMPIYDGLVMGGGVPWYVLNDGLVTAAAFAVAMDSGTLVNDATIESRYGISVNGTTATGSIINHNVISATVRNGLSDYGSGALYVYNSPGATISGGNPQFYTWCGIYDVHGTPRVVNAGLIEAAYGIVSHNNLSLTNSGTITGAHKGIYVGYTTPGTAYITNLNGGLITAGATTGILIVPGDVGTIVNDGRIAGPEAVEIGSGSVLNQGTIRATAYNAIVDAATAVTSLYVSNASGALIEGGDSIVNPASTVTHRSYGIYADYYVALSVVNAGTISGVAGIVGHRGISLTNSGVIEGADQGVTAYRGISLTNSGVIEGADQGVTAYGSIDITNAPGGIIAGTTQAGIHISYGNGTIVNAGTIETLATHGRAIDLGGGTIGVVIEPGAVENGYVVGGGAQDTLAFGTVGGPGTLAALGSQFQNFGSVLIQAGGLWTANGTNDLAGVTVAGTLDVVDTATLNSSGSFTVLAGGTVTLAGYTGITAQLGISIDNAGLVAGGTDAFYIGGGVVLDNRAGGTISNTGLYDVEVEGGTVVNDGTLVSHYGTALDAFGVNDAIYNSGAISGAVDGAVLSGSQTLDNYASGFITASTDGVKIESGTLFNSGTIASYGNGVNAYNLFLGSGAYVENQGFISGSINGVVVGSGFTLHNDAHGTIDGYNGINVQYGGRNPAETALYNAGLIEGGFAGTLSGATIAVDNLGTMSGSSGGFRAYGTLVSVTNGAGADIYGARHFGLYLSGSSGATLVDDGRIGVGSAIYDAVTFAPGPDNRLIVGGSAAVGGAVDGGNTIGSSYASTLEVSAGGGTLYGFGSVITNFAEITLDPGADWLLQSRVADFGGATIEGLFAGSTIELMGTAESLGALAGGVLTLSGGTTLDLPGLPFANVTQDGINTYITACFASGTEIMTAAGKLAVENLAEGDLVLTATGRFAPVRWIGHRRTSLAKHPSPLDVMPVRVRAGAFGDSQPARDLVLSPDHAVYVDARLIPVRYLINNVSIVQEARETITYWHVELDRHDVILAEGLPCESYLDTGNRNAFENAPGAVQMSPDFARAVWATGGCALIVTDPADPALRALHTRLLARGRRLPREVCAPALKSV